MRARLARPGVGAILVAVWVALWADLTVANVVSGLLVALVVLAVVPVGVGGPNPRLVPGARFLAVFAYKLVESSLIVGWEVATPRNRIREGIVAVPLGDLPDRVITVVANAISLTPGTLTLEVERDPTVLYVHVLHLESVEAARHDVLAMTRLVCAAFGCPPPPTVASAGLDRGGGGMA